MFLLINNFTTGNTYTFTIIFLLQVLKRMREIIGFSEGDSILAPGGSISNMYGLLCARHRFFPDYKTKGTSAMDQSQIAIYTSAQVRKKIVYSIVLSLFLVDHVFLEILDSVFCKKRQKIVPDQLLVEGIRAL